MKKVLVGHTGLVGSTLSKNINFDYKFNSSNIQELYNIEDNCALYLSCLPAVKWKANKHPIEDYENIISIFKIIKSKTYSEVNLISTIDVYEENILGSNEDDLPIISKLGYGQNRYIFEILVNTLSSPIIKIIRLPGLFGKGLKKNLIFDLLTNHRIEYINSNSILQWYDLKDLTLDIQSLPNCKGIYNFFPEPLHTSEIFKLFGVTPQLNSTKGVTYNYKTKYTNSGYIYSKEKSLEKLKTFIDEFKH